MRLKNKFWLLERKEEDGEYPSLAAAIVEGKATTQEDGKDTYIVQVVRVIRKSAPPVVVEVVQ